MAVPHGGVPSPSVPPSDATTNNLTVEGSLTVDGASTLGAVVATSVSAPHGGLTGVTADQHHAQLHGHTGADGSGAVAHADTTGRTANDHHAQLHGHTGADGSGTVAHSDITGQGANDHHAQSHAHNGIDGSGSVDHGAMTGLADDDHSQYLTQARHDVLGSCILVTRPTAQSIANNTLTTIVMDTIVNEDDVDGNLSHNVTTGVLTLVTAGWYHVDAGVIWASNSTGERLMRILLNGTDDIVSDRRTALTNSVATISKLRKFSAGDTIEVNVRQQSGASLDTFASEATFLSVQRVRS